VASWRAGVLMEFLVLGGALRCERVVSHKVFAFVWWFVFRNVIAVERRAKAQRLHTYRKPPTRRAIRSKLVVEATPRCRQIHLAKIGAW
jgi:hypothetical protein